MPHRPFAIAILVRAAGSWITVRIAMTLLLGAYEQGPSLALNALASFGVVVVACAVVLLDLTRLNERLFLENLGVSTGVLVGLAAGPPIALEAAAMALLP